MAIRKAVSNCSWSILSAGSVVASTQAVLAGLPTFSPVYTLARPRTPDFSGSKASHHGVSSPRDSFGRRVRGLTVHARLLLSSSITVYEGDKEDLIPRVHRDGGGHVSGECRGPGTRATGAPRSTPSDWYIPVGRKVLFDGGLDLQQGSCTKLRNSSPIRQP